MTKEETATSMAPEKKEADVLVLELVDSKKSGFIMDGPGVDDFEKIDKVLAISFPSLRQIRKTSRIKVPVGNTFTYKKIRYISGCSFIDKDQQDKEGWKPNHLADGIIFKNGNLRVVNEGNIGLYNYLKACEYNVDAPDRPDDAEGIFREINTVINAEETESLFDLENQAMQVLSGLKEKVGDGKFRYNEDQLQFLCSIFKVPAIESGYKSEAWVAIASIARNDPKRFLQSIANKRTLIEADVYSAVQFGVVKIDLLKSFFTDGNKLVTTFSKDMTEEDKGQALVDFMSNPKNHLFYDQLRMQLKAKREAMAGTVTN